MCTHATCVWRSNASLSCVPVLLTVLSFRHFDQTEQPARSWDLPDFLLAPALGVPPYPSMLWVLGISCLHSIVFKTGVSAQRQFTCIRYVCNFSIINICFFVLLPVLFAQSHEFCVTLECICGGVGTGESSTVITSLRCPFSVHLGVSHISGQNDFSVTPVRT